MSFDARDQPDLVRLDPHTPPHAVRAPNECNQRAGWALACLHIGEGRVGSASKRGKWRRVDARAGVRTASLVPHALDSSKLKPYSQCEILLISVTSCYRGLTVL